MPWWIASLIANVAVIGCEYFNRTSPGGWENALPKTFLLIVIAQWGLYQAFVGAPHWLTAWAVFTLGNAVMRIAAVNLFMGSEVGNWFYAAAGIAVMIAGSLVLKLGLR